MSQQPLEPPVPLPPARPLPPSAQWRPADDDWDHVRRKATTYTLFWPVMFWIFAVALAFDDGATSAVVFLCLSVPFLVLHQWVRRLPRRAQRRVARAVAAGVVEPVRLVRAARTTSNYGIVRLWISVQRADESCIFLRVPQTPLRVSTALTTDQMLWLVTARGGRFGALVDPVIPTQTRYLRGPVPLPHRKLPRLSGVRRLLDDRAHSYLYPETMRDAQAAHD